MANRIRSTRFNQLNPGLNCNNLVVGSNVCLNDGNTGCIRYLKLNGTTSCQSIANTIGINIITLKAINVHLDCSKPISTKYICAEAVNPECESLYKVKNGDTIATIISSNGLTDDQFYNANPYAYENGIQVNQNICLKKTIDSSSIFDSYFNAYTNLADYSSKLKMNLGYYLANPSKQNADVLQKTYLSEMLTNAAFRQYLKGVEQTDPAFVEFFTSRNVSKATNV